VSTDRSKVRFMTKCAAARPSDRSRRPALSITEIAFVATKGKKALKKMKDGDELGWRPANRRLFALNFSASAVAFLTPDFVNPKMQRYMAGLSRSRHRGRRPWAGEMACVGGLPAEAIVDTCRVAKKAMNSFQSRRCEVCVLLRLRSRSKSHITFKSM
jgi:hypothetical protein